MRALLLYNPVAGRNRERRSSQINAALAILRERGFIAEAASTLGKGQGGSQAADAIRDGVKAVFACGGDGTIHDVLQGVVGTSAVLGVLPFGSANALTCELGLPGNPVRAAQRYSPDRIREIRVGLVKTAERESRYFLTMAGAGPDGQLMYRMLTIERHRWGRWAYYLHALRVFCRESLPLSHVHWSTEDSELHEADAVAVLALRVGQLGGIFRGIARGASLEQDALHTVLVRAPAWRNLPLWFVASWFHLTRHHPGLQVLSAQRLRLTASGRVHVQADGEWVGTLPAEISLSRHVIRMFAPERARAAHGIPASNGKVSAK